VLQQIVIDSTGKSSTVKKLFRTVDYREYANWMGRARHLGRAKNPHYHVDKNGFLAWWGFAIRKRCLCNDEDIFYENTF